MNRRYLPFPKTPELKSESWNRKKTLSIIGNHLEVAGLLSGIPLHPFWGTPCALAYLIIGSVRRDSHLLILSCNATCFLFPCSKNYEWKLVNMPQMVWISTCEDQGCFDDRWWYRTSSFDVAIDVRPLESRTRHSGTHIFVRSVGKGVYLMNVLEVFQPRAAAVLHWALSLQPMAAIAFPRPTLSLQVSKEKPCALLIRRGRAQNWALVFV
jgi:hypothetical protein